MRMLLACRTIYYVKWFRAGKLAQLLIRRRESGSWAANLLEERYDGVRA